jgi:UDP-2-acetamido-3-amino-2,3-dideoxy-glucuronate N-acetyltransferase
MKKSPKKVNKIGLIGFGYWGKILYKNLKKFNLDISIVDSNGVDLSFVETKDQEKIFKDYHNINVDCVIVSTPAVSHFDVCSFFLKKGINVFCEKPLSLTVSECKDLYKIAEENDSILFVDWVFLYNPAVNKIKEIIDNNILGELLSVTMKRLNKGPIRKDVNARYDLMSHDISIILYLLNKIPENYKFFDFSKNSSSWKDDSCIGLIKFKNHLICTIECSWEHPVKDRECIFEFEKGVLFWDDTLQKIELPNETFIPPKDESPLELSLKSFLFLDNFNYHYQKELTLGITKILES